MEKGGREEEWLFEKDVCEEKGKKGKKEEERSLQRKEKGREETD